MLGTNAGPVPSPLAARRPGHARQPSGRCDAPVHSPERAVPAPLRCQWQRLSSLDSRRHNTSGLPSIWCAAGCRRACLRHAPRPLAASGLDIRLGHPAAENSCLKRHGQRLPHGSWRRCAMSLISRETLGRPQSPQRPTSSCCSPQRLRGHDEKPGSLDPRRQAPAPSPAWSSHEPENLRAQSQARADEFKAKAQSVTPAK